MKTIKINVPDGKSAEWVNGVLTLVDVNPGNVMERVKTFEDACKELGENHPYVQTWNSIYEGTENDTDLTDHIAYMKLRIICVALNEGWQPEFKEGEYRYYPWFTLYTKEEIDDMDDEEKKKLCLWCGYANSGPSCGLVSSTSTTAFSHSHPTYGARLASKTKEIAEYFGKQFINIWKDFIICK